MSAVRVGVLRGGIGHEYDVSLASGNTVLKTLPRDKYLARDILITKDGTWHLDGLPTTLPKLAQQIDVVFNALHGEFGEDGQVQQLLDQTGIPYTGSGHYASAMGMNKVKAKQIFKDAGLKVATHRLVENAEDAATIARDVFYSLCPPWVVKPANSGSSVGLSIARNIAELETGIRTALQFSDKVIVEEYVRGKEATVGIIDDFRGETHYALLPVEIRIPKGKVFDYDLKYGGEAEELCPGTFLASEKEELQRVAREVHKLLGLRHYSRTDMILTPRGVYVLEVNTLPGLTPESLLPKSLAAVGSPLGHFLDHIVSLAQTQ